MKITPRHFALTVMLALTLTAVALVNGEPSNNVVAANASQTIVEVHSPEAVTEPDRSESVAKPWQPRVSKASIKNVFASSSWVAPIALIKPIAQPPVFVAPPVSEVPVVQALPPPSAPPLPFKYVGRLKDKDQPEMIFLLKGTQLYTVGEGDTIETNYHVSKVGPREIRFIYLPLQIEQTLVLEGQPNV